MCNFMFFLGNISHRLTVERGVCTITIRYRKTPILVPESDLLSNENYFYFDKCLILSNIIKVQKTKGHRCFIYSI